MIESNTSEFQWKSDVPNDVWVLGLPAHPYSVECLLDVLGEQPISLFPESHKTAFKELNIDNTNGFIPWRWVLGDRLFMKRLQCAVEKARLNVCALEDSNYEQTYKKIRKFLLDLKEPQVDHKRIRHYIQKNDKGMTVEASLKSFIDEKSANAPKIKYDQAGTATGRLTVKSGPRILTLPSRYRDIIKPSRGCEVVQIDLVSAEPRTALHVAGKEAKGDVYKSIARDLGLDLPRDIVKVASLSALYGAGSSSLASSLGSRTQAKRVISQLRRHFGVERIESQLASDMKRDGYITNLFGRKLMTRPDEIQKAYSHFMQSTTSDAAICMFSDICTELVSHDKQFRPFYVIHDALVCEVTKSLRSELESITNNLLLEGILTYETKMTSINNN